MTKTLATTDDDIAQSPRELALWQEVLLRAIDDARSPYESPERREARKWFIEAGYDLDLVVDLAGFDRDAVHDALPTMIASWRDSAACDVTKEVKDNSSELMR
jgi:hypothetical protein